jgi:CarD family transcriptional regulator
LVRLAVGDVVVHPAHGVGRVVARTERPGDGRELVVLELAQGLAVTLPVEYAIRVLRAPVNEADIRRLQETLREESVVSAGSWLTRMKGTQAKLTDGDPLRLAEVVRDGAGRARVMTAKGAGARLSPSERDAYLRARTLLSDEISSSRGLAPAEADAWIEEQLTGSVEPDGVHAGSR